ncbi:DUF3108 domain-containing protein [Endozoicomonas sp. 8E]|uniref:DUF3108 domain-containing protein n=1 Tax=Endozoicomonas sp. 8E TaxID=3035692 RepID=UPI002939274A|nr:DUF3108 domain-containing protein [Endozoicomonas sp. 8E]WOG26142.1 DUF3108 domain-containing protein [Endozoicomonas sp. 8E]
MTSFKTVSALLASGLLIASTPSIAKPEEATLKPFTAEYKAKVSGISGSGTRSLKKEGDQWVLDFGASASVMIASISLDESSRFNLQKGQALPQDYQYERKGIGSKPAKTARFDWKSMEASWQQAEKQSKIPFKSGVQDPLSYQLQLRLDLKAGKKELTYPIVDDDEIYERRFVIEADEVLNTPAGPLNTTRVKVVREDNDRETWIWFAKDWDYVLVQLHQKENGSDYLIQFKGGELDGRSIKGITPTPSK